MAYTVHGHFERRDGSKEGFFTHTGLSKNQAQAIARGQRSEGGIARIVNENPSKKRKSKGRKRRASGGKRRRASRGRRHSRGRR